MTSNGACMESTGTPASTVSIVAVCQIHGNRAAAALIDFAELTGLPNHIRLVENAADARHQLRGRVRRARLTARACVLDQREATVSLGVVALLGNTG